MEYVNPDDPAFEPAIVRVPLPPDFADERDVDVLARASALCGAAEDILKKAIESGQPIPAVSDADRTASRALFDAGPDEIPETMPTGMALHLSSLLNKYDMQVVQSAQQIRNLCMNVMVEKAVKGKSEQVQLRAVEMLGKVKDVGLFEERSTVTVEHMTSDDIRQRLRGKIDRLKRLVTDDAIDVTPAHTPTVNELLAQPDPPEE